MKKQIAKMAAAAAFAGLTLGSCATISGGAAIAEKGPIGQKVGEAQSTIILGLFSQKGEQNNIKQAAQNGGITKVMQVEYVDQSILLGLFVKRITRVYGE